jgi:hypothetical protein
MAGKHSKPTGKSKAPIVIIIVVSVIILAAAVFAFLFFGGVFGSKDNKQNASVPATIASETTAPAMTVAPQTTAPAHDYDSDEDSSESGESNVVVVPTEAEGEISHFNATFIPNGKVVDTVSGNETSLREVFGSGYNTSGVITFNNDGTFSDTIPSENARTGGYVVQNNKIIATYSDDKNMEITVTEWDGNTPASFYIVYAGYNVYFG